MFVAFVDDPGAEPDSSCTTEMGMRFETPGGQSPESGPIELAPFESTELEIAGVVPVGWAQVDDGVWSRAALATDATVLVQRAIPADRSDEALAGLLGEFGASELGELSKRST